MGKRTLSIIISVFGILLLIVNYCLRYSYPLLYPIGILLIFFGVCRCIDANKPLTERRPWLRFFGLLLGLLGIQMVVFAIFGNNGAALLLGAIMIIGGATIFFNPYLIKKKK